MDWIFQVFVLNKDFKTFVRKFHAILQKVNMWRKLHAWLSMFGAKCFDLLVLSPDAAEAMVNGKKQIENRSWKIPMGWWLGRMG